MKISDKNTILGIDYGEKNIGIAIGDRETGLVIPKTTILNPGKESLLTYLVDFCQDWEVEVVVIGLPLNMKAEHKENKILKEIKDLATELEEKLNGKSLTSTDKESKKIKIELLDERLSTFEAKNQISKLNLPSKSSKKSKKKQQNQIDSSAAKIIVERYLSNS